MLAQEEDKKFWLKWLERYKSSRCLWDEYAKREASSETRRTAYKELAKLIRDEGIKEDADVYFVRSRINSFRTGYRRELHKVKVAKENGCNYEPKLFYYKALDFLDDSSIVFDTKNYSESEENDDLVINASHNKPKERKVYLPSVTSAFKVESNNSLSSSTMENTSNDEVNYLPPNKIANRTAADDNHFSRGKQRQPYAEITDSLDSNELESQQSVQSVSIAPLKNESDEYDILGKRIAAHFRNMSPIQRLLAEKIITEVCINGRMEKLTLDSAFYVDPTETVEQKNYDAYEDVDYDNPDTFIYAS